MKTILFFLGIILTTSFQTINAQCVRQAGQFGNHPTIPMYNITGNVNITLNTGGQTITMDTESNFLTANGPDVNAYLVKSNGMTTGQIVATPLASLENIHFGLISNDTTVFANGVKSFTVNIPNGVNIEEYDTVYFYCFQFSAFWDLGKITPFTPENCTVLGIEDDFFDKQLTMYPNPTKNNLYINTDLSEEINIKIYTILGEILLEEKIINTTIINTESFKNGLYLVEISSGNKKITKKLIKN